MAKVQLKRQVRLDVLLDELVAAAVACGEVAGGATAAPESRRQLEHKLRARFRDILRMDMEVGEQCGLSILCQESAVHEPWSEEAERALREDEQDDPQD
jgi:hypothetical protein